MCNNGLHQEQWQDWDEHLKSHQYWKECIHRHLHQLRLNRNTVAKAYTELESQGVIETAAGKGCFFRANRSPFNAGKKREVLIPEIDSLVVKAHHLQVGNVELRKLVEERLDALATVRQKHSTQKP